MVCRGNVVVNPGDLERWLVSPSRDPPGSCRIRSSAYAGSGATPGRADPTVVPMETADYGYAR